MKRILLLIFLTCITASSQSESQVSKVPDSLESKTYFELYELFFTNYREDLQKAHVYARAYLEKSRNENKKNTQGHGYYLVSHLYKGNELYLKYVDSMIQLSKKTKNTGLLTQGHLLIGDYFLSKGQFKDAWDNYTKAEVIALKYPNKKNRYYYNRSIGRLKSRLGKHEEVLKIFEKCYEYAKKEDLESQQEDIYIISREWVRMNVLDSAKYYNDLGVKKALENNNKYSHNLFLLNTGVTKYHEGEYRSGTDAILKALPYLNTSKEIEPLITSYFYLGASFSKLNEKNKSIFYLKKMDSIAQIDKLITPDLRKGYELLLNHSENLKDNKNKLMYAQRISELDSILAKNTTGSLMKTIERYDFPPIVLKKDVKISRLRAILYNYKLIIILMVFLLISTIGIIIYFYNDRNRYRKSFRAVVSYTNKVQVVEPNAEKNKKQQLDDLNISPESIQKILEGLQGFEGNKRYLSKKYTQNVLSKELKTNSTYLSKIINVYKEKNFSNYLHDLRIGYAIERLRDDEKFRLYSIKGISEEVGFKTSESFSKAFHKKTGIYPSSFINKLKNT